MKPSLSLAITTPHPHKTVSNTLHSARLTVAISPHPFSPWMIPSKSWTMGKIQQIF